METKRQQSKNVGCVLINIQYAHKTVHQTMIVVNHISKQTDTTDTITQSLALAMSRQHTSSLLTILEWVSEWVSEWEGFNVSINTL